MTPRQAEFVRAIADPWRMVPLMTIADNEGKVSALKDTQTGLSDEQLITLESLIENPKTIVLKARKLWVSTICAAFMVHRATTRPGYNVLTMGHEDGSAKTMNRMHQLYFEGLTTKRSKMKSGLGLPFKRGDPWNTDELTIDHGKGVKSALRCSVAGGRSGARAHTYHGGHYTEAGFYPRGSSSQGRSGGQSEGADDYAFFSSQSSFTFTEESRVVVESTADGPFGILYKLWTSEKGWNRLFFPWYTSRVYRRPAPPDFERNDEEERLARSYNLDNDQLYWRRCKLEDDKYTVERFRKEYPLEDSEPFLLSGGLWYDPDKLEVLRSGKAEWARSKPTGWRVYHPYNPRLTYFIGGDPSGGVGEDSSAACIIDSLGRIAATFNDPYVSEWGLAEEVARVSAAWGGARILIEENNHGKACLKRLKQLGANLWLPPTATEENQRAGIWVDPGVKLSMVNYSRELVRTQQLDIQCPWLLDELGYIKMNKAGNVCAEIGHHDDLHSAFYLACWNARGHLDPTLITDKSLQEEIGKRRRRAAEEAHARIWDKYLSKVA